MRFKAFLGTLLVTAAMGLVLCGSASALEMNAGASINGYFSTTWTGSKPNLNTSSSLVFKSGTNYSLDPSQVTGDFAWDGTGVQPDYTMDPNGSITQYVGHIGGSTNSLQIGNLSFNPSGNGQNFMTWYVDVPSAGTGVTDKLSFSLISEQVVSKTTTGNSENLSLYLLGYVTDADNHWTSSLASLNLTVSETIVGSNYGYSWAATWASPPASAPPQTPEPPSILLLGLGLLVMVLMFAVSRHRKARHSA